MKKLVILGLLFAVALSFAPLFSSAQGGLVPCGFDQNGDGEVKDIDLNGDGKIEQGIDLIENCQLCHLFQLIYNIINWVLFVLIPILAPIFVVIGGIYLLIGRGNPETYSKGKSVLTATVIGLIIVYTAYVLLSTVLTLLGVMEWTGLETWWQPECPT